MNHHKLFDLKSENYVESRPKYPQEIYEFLVSVCSAKKIAWDAACGNGQAAVSLAQHFEKVEASDISEWQISNAIQTPKVTYSVQSSENTNFFASQFDLVCVAQALHWFDYQVFWPEVRRVLKPAGVIAAWGYSWFSIEDAINELIKEKILKYLGPFWAPQNKLLWDNYRDVPFPFERLDVPKIEMKTKWNLIQLFAYLQSWSAVRLCMKKNGSNFFDLAFEAVKTKWGVASNIKTVEMDFCMLAGRNET